MNDDTRKQATWGRIGGLKAWSRNGAATMLGPARRGFIARFEKEVDPEGILPPAERTRRAERARRAYMLELAELSAAARRAKKKATPAGRSAEVAEEDADVRGDPRPAA